jgi:hypothetical protein
MLKFSLSTLSHKTLQISIELLHFTSKKCVCVGGRNYKLVSWIFIYSAKFQVPLSEQQAALKHDPASRLLVVKIKQRKIPSLKADS